MKVVCVDNTRGNTRYLEVNKVYDTVELTDVHKSYPVIGEHYIIDYKQWTNSLRPENNDEKIFLNEIWVNKKDMITLEEWRQQKLDKLI